MRKLVTNIVPERILREAQLRALKTYSDVIECTYGPMGGYTTYAKTNVDNKTMAVSYYSKDGLTILKNVEVDQPIEALLKDELIDICSNVVKVIGDGTSSAVLLAYRIFQGMLDLHNQGYLRRNIIKAFKEIVEDMIERIDSNKRETTLDDIYNIALTSTNGNDEMAKIISQIYSEYGMGVWIEAQASSGPETIIKGYDGMIYDSGYLDPCFINNEDAHTCELNNPHIYVFESPIDTPDMISLFSLIIQKEINDPLQLYKLRQQGSAKQALKDPIILKDVLIICPFISRDANSYLDQLISAFTQTTAQNRLHLCVVSDMNDDPAKLIDIMKLTGAKFIKKYIDPEQYKIDKKNDFAPTPNNIKTFAGTAEKVIIDSVSTRIINPAKMRDENGTLTTFFRNYVDELKDILAKKKETREDIVNIVKLERRIHNILGNIVDLYIGGIGTSDRKSLADFVDDAILNCRSAAKDGVGYGASFEALKVAYEMARYYDKVFDEDDSAFIKTKHKMMNIVLESYMSIVYLLYKDKYISKKYAVEKIIESVSTDEGLDRGPLNVITDEYDGQVLTSIKTDIAILDSLSKIITIIFDTNQYLVPTPQFNCYTENEELVVDGRSNSIKLDTYLGKEEKEITSPPFTSDVDPNHPHKPDPNTPKEPVEEHKSKPILTDEEINSLLNTTVEEETPKQEINPSHDPVADERIEAVNKELREKGFLVTIGKDI